jgi:hypothetical protein
MAEREVSAGEPICCVFIAMRGVDAVFKRSVLLVDVPRVGERIHMWFPGARTVRGTVRDVQWSIPEHGAVTVTIQVLLSDSDRQRFATRSPIDTAGPSES